MPDGRALLYGFIVDAYLGTLDKERGLEHLRPIPHNVEEMSRWLAAVGWHLQRRRGATGDAEEGRRAESEVLLGRDELIGILERVIRPKPPRPGEPPLSARETAALFLEYAGRRSGLLLPRGEERYAFLHLSFQEYFAALHFRGRILSGNWWTAREPRPADGTGRDDLRNYAAAPAWRETLIFLWESASLVSDELGQSLIAALFDWEPDPTAWPPFPAPTVAGMEDKEKRAALTLASKPILLVASLAVDPHVELTDAARRALWEHCWEYEIAWQDSAWKANAWDEFIKAGIARRLLSRTICLGESARIFGAAARRAQPAALNLRGITALSDLSPLAGLTSLQGLWLNGCTALSDLSPLAGLTGLQQLWLDGCTALNEEAVAKLQQALPHLRIFR